MYILFLLSSAKQLHFLDFLIIRSLSLHDSFRNHIPADCTVKSGQHIAIDGKAIRAATKKAADGSIPYASAKEYGSLAREHWEIENSLHWVLDIHFKEDSSTANTDNALANLAPLRKIAFNFTVTVQTPLKKHDEILKDFSSYPNS